ncbi:hypothetical protein BKA70DRAFT_1416343 [Coprinopsis sp. MPI-PUGE-AT-0042]|nr:hypothetical protein BKA70DRAFT_1416343 [Coprinopsis sp. MPI-PUGE-AT-0042]
MSLSNAIPIKFESASRVLATPRAASGRFGSILFDRPGKSGQGIRLTAAPGTPILSGGEATPSGYTLPKMTLKMTWPGYTTEMKAVISSGKATRQQLAAAVAREFTKYVMEASRKEGSKGRMPLNPASMCQLVLVSLCHISDDLWQADIAVDTQSGAWV